jgi:hypothetical protein
MRGVRSDFRRHFFAIYDNALTVGELAEGEERAVWAQLTQEASLKDGEGVREIAQPGTSPRRSSSDKSEAKSAPRSAVKPSKKNLEIKILVAITVFCL